MTECPSRSAELSRRPAADHYDVVLACGREPVGRVGTAVTRPTGEIAVETGAVPVGPHFHLLLRPVRSDAPPAAELGPLARDLLCDPDELHAFLTAALDAYDRAGDAAALRRAVATARDALAGDGR